jgi:predicted N-acetyltransferase YhbS
MRVVTRWETELTEADHVALSALLHAAFSDHGDEFATKSWPTGYARKEARLWLADETGRPVAHLSVERRLVGVDGADVLVAGVGEVAVAPDLHGTGVGAMLMRELDPRLRAEFAADFGFVQCGENVVGFYRRSGWTQVANPVRHLDTKDLRTVRDGVWPTLVRPGRRPVSEWPDGLVDLRGLPW